MKLYHGSADFLPRGTLLKPRSRAGLIDDEFKLHELLTLHTFDYFKPSGLIGRLQAIYCTDAPELCSPLGAWGEMVFEVTPLGKVEKYHASWFPALLNYLTEATLDIWEQTGPLTLKQAVALLPQHGWPTSEMEAIAADYWAGLAADDHDHWEYLMRSAVVVHEVEVPEVSL